MQTDNDIFSDLTIEILGDYRMQNLQYFAIVASALRIAPTKSIATAGIFLYENNPNVYLLYNVKYVISLDTKEKRFLFFHLLLHLVLKTKERASINFHNPILSHITHDMIVNHLIQTYFGDYTSPPVKDIALPPKNYKEELTYESLYDYLEDEFNKMQDEADKLKKFFEKMGIKPIDEELGAQGQTFDSHMDEGINELTMPEQLRTLNNTIGRGLESSNMIEMINNIMSTGKVNVLEFIDKYTRSMRGNTRKLTWNRRNRKYPGVLKGHKNQIIYFNLILDTSGSMRTEDMKGLLGTVMKNGISFNLIQIDTQIKDMILIRNPRDLSVLDEFKGRGGTVLQPAIDYCLKHNLNEPVVVLTDGYTDSLSFHNRTLIVYTDTPSPIEKGEHLVTQIRYEK